MPDAHAVCRLTGPIPAFLRDGGLRRLFAAAQETPNEAVLR